VQAPQEYISGADNHKH